MVPAADHEFFTAAAAATGTLIGLLFVALSVWQESDDGRGRVETHRLRAAAALTGFINVLTLSLFALIPQDDFGETTTVLAIVGLVSVLASGLRVVRLRRDGVGVRVRDLVFVAGGGVLFVIQLLSGTMLWEHPHRSGLVQDLAELMIFFLLFAIARSWELIGGPEVGFVREAAQILHRPSDAEPRPPVGAGAVDAADPSSSSPAADAAESADPGGPANPVDP